MNASDFIDRLFEELADRSNDPFGSTDSKNPWVGALASFGREAVPALVRQARKGKPFRNIAMLSLGRIGADAIEAAALLVRVLKEKDEEFALGPVPPSLEASVAEVALCQMRPPAALPQLIRILTHGPDCARAGAAAVCGSIGPEARDALPALK